MGKILFGALLALVAGPACAEVLSTMAAAVASWLGPTGTAMATATAAAAGAKKLLTPKAPGVAAPKTMPTADDAAVQAARRRQVAEMQARGGRASTILSDGDKLGG